MEPTHYDKLKSLLIKEGFEINFHHDRDTFLVKPVPDDWEGVKYARIGNQYKGSSEFLTIGSIYPIKFIKNGFIDLAYDNTGNEGNGIGADCCKPATREDYFNQLKALALNLGMC